MINSLKTSKIVAAVAGLGLAASLLVGVSANVASAQSMTLAQLVNLFISLGIIPPSEAAAAQAAIANSSASTAYTFNTDLTVGSTGADVTALQNDLIANGDLASGLNTGYFGALTKAGVMKWQAANGISATGYFGPISRAKINGSSSMTTTTTTTTNNTTVTNNNTTVTNTGVEGILTVNLNSTPSSGQNVYEGDSKDALIGIKLQAQLSPISIQRVQVDLGNSTTFYTKYFSNLYLVSDTGQVLATAALNTNTVTKQTSGSSNEYYLTFSGFNYVVPGDNSVHVLTVEGDLYSSIDSSLDGASIPVTIDQNGIRGVDGAGVDQYGPNAAAGISNSVTLQGSLSSSAQLQLSTDSATPLATQAVASQGSADNELDGQTALVFDLYAQKDWIQLDNLTAGINSSGSGTATATTAYLYAGSQQVSSAAVSYNGTGQYGTAVFTNIDYKVAQNTTQPFTVKVDIKSANSLTKTIYATVTAAYVLAENSQGNTLFLAGSAGSTGNPTVSGSATGNNITVNSGGPVFSLSGTPTITTGSTAVINNNSTSTLQAVFNVQIQALGTNVYFGDQAASSTFKLGVYLNGSEVGTQLVASSTAVQVPSSGVVTTGLPGVTGGSSGTAFELQQNNTVTIPITFNMQGRVSATGASITYGSYAIGLDSINWSLDGFTVKNSNFMTGQTSWRTPTAQNFP